MLGRFAGAGAVSLAALAGADARAADPFAAAPVAAALGLPVVSPALLADEGGEKTGAAPCSVSRGGSCSVGVDGAGAGVDQRLPLRRRGLDHRCRRRGGAATTATAREREHDRDARQEHRRRATAEQRGAARSRPEVPRSGPAAARSAAPGSRTGSLDRLRNPSRQPPFPLLRAFSSLIGVSSFICRVPEKPVTEPLKA